MNRLGPRRCAMTTNSTELRKSLERRLAELSEEIRRYPTPIARCDEHLADLLERRSRVIDEIRRADVTQAHAPGCTATAVWINDGGFHAA